MVYLLLLNFQLNSADCIAVVCYTGIMLLRFLER